MRWSAFILLFIIAMTAAAATFKETEQKAENGDVSAQLALANSYLHGNGVTQNFQLAARWFRRSALQGNAQAQSLLGSLYASGQGVKQDLQAALHWYGKAVAQDNVSAQFNLATMFMKGEGVKQDYQRALNLLGKAAEHGLDHAQYNIGLMYQQGLGVKKDYRLALPWFKKAADQGHKYAKEHYYYFSKLAAADSASQDFRKNLKLGDVSHCGVVVEVNKTKAKVNTAIGKKWFQRKQLYRNSGLPCEFVNGVYQKPYHELGDY